MKTAILVAILCIGLVAVAAAVTLDNTIVMNGKDVSLVKGYADYKGVTNNTITQHEQYVYAVNLAAFDYNSTAMITDFHNVAIETELEATRAPYSGIGGAEYIENVGSGDNESCCVFGVYGSGHDLTVASIIGIQPTVLNQAYVLEAGNGEVGTGYIKGTENITAKGKYIIRGKEAFIAGQRTCVKAPASPTAEGAGKPKFCVYQGKGLGYPVFSDRKGDETASTYNYYVKRGGLNIA
jgi:hypothetical protein